MEPGHAAFSQVISFCHGTHFGEAPGPWVELQTRSGDHKLEPGRGSFLGT